MSRGRRLAFGLSLLVLSACAGMGSGTLPYVAAVEGWLAQQVSTRPVGLGLAGATLAPGVRFAGGLELVLPPGSPLHGLSDLKLTGDSGFISVTDAGDLVRGRIQLDGTGRLSDLDGLAFRRLTLTDGSPIIDKQMGDAEGLALTPDGNLLVSFERVHRIWNYGSLQALGDKPRALHQPSMAFPENAGMEGLANSASGWLVAAESGGVWDCSATNCNLLMPVPTRTLRESDYRITALDLDPSGGGWFVVERAVRFPAGLSSRVRRLSPDGRLGPILIDLRFPATTDNFEGIAAESRDGTIRLYILSDDNANPMQRSLMLAFDLEP
jgi:hypothetical protein